MANFGIRLYRNYESNTWWKTGKKIIIKTYCHTLGCSYPPAYIDTYGITSCEDCMGILISSGNEPSSYRELTMEVPTPLSKYIGWDNYRPIKSTAIWGDRAKFNNDVNYVDKTSDKTSCRTCRRRTGKQCSLLKAGETNTKINIKGTCDNWKCRVF